MTYKITRNFFDLAKERKVIREGLTLEEAQEHCNDLESSSTTCTTEPGITRTQMHGPWFDSYTEE